jgi:hypothetical protein
VADKRLPGVVIVELAFYEIYIELIFISLSDNHRE